MNSHALSSPASPVSATFCSNLAQGIHAAAQPLTVLLASLSKGHTDPMSRDELRELTASSAVEVQRVCTLFSCLQQLVMAEGIKPQLSATPVLPLLTHVVEGVHLLFEEDGIPFLWTPPATCPPALINGSRTTQALTRLLMVVHGLSTGRQPVELVASFSADSVHIALRSQQLSVTVIHPEASLSLAVAEANMRSQHAGFSLTLQPFTVRIDLPKARPAY